MYSSYTALLDVFMKHKHTRCPVEKERATVTCEARIEDFPSVRSHKYPVSKNDGYSQHVDTKESKVFDIA